MSSTAPVLTVHALFDALNDHDVDQAARCVDPSYHGVDATRSALTVGRDDARAERGRDLYGREADSATADDRHPLAGLDAGTMTKGVEGGHVSTPECRHIDAIDARGQ